MQHIEPGQQVPGFWLPDGRGGLVRTKDHRGKVLLIYMFAADDLIAARTLPALERIAKEYDGKGVQPIGVCLSPDHGDGAALVRTGGYRFPIGSDPTTLKTASPPESAVATAYDVQLLPALVVTDRRRRARQVLTGLPVDLALLRKLVDERLSAEPE